jgi:alpha-ribazole phosphatase
MQITLVRHTSVACGPTICYGQTDVDVAESFMEEAEKVKYKIANRQFDSIYSSPLQRCTKLADYCGYSNPIWDRRLMELDFGDWEGIPWAEITDPHIEDWYKDWINTRTTNGESFADQVERVKIFLDELKATKHENVLIFTHAGIIRAIAILLKLVVINQAFSDYKVEYGEVLNFEI